MKASAAHIATVAGRRVLALVINGLLELYELDAAAEAELRADLGE